MRRRIRRIKERLRQAKMLAEELRVVRSRDRRHAAVAAHA